MQLLKAEVKGFNGITHVYIAVVVYLLFLFASQLLIQNVPNLNTPAEFRGSSYPWLNTFYDAIHAYFSNTVLSVTSITISILLVAGGSLFPDLDTTSSTAMHRLGSTGRILSFSMQKISKFIWNLYHLKYDHKPSYKHRAFFHTPFATILLFCLAMLIPSRSTGMFEEIFTLYVKELPEYIVNNLIAFLFCFMFYLFLKLILSTLAYNTIRKFVRNKEFVELGCSIIAVLMIFYICSHSYEFMKIMAVTVVIGYATHLIGDFFTTGSIPIWYPIPVRVQAYYRPNHFLQTATNEEDVRPINRWLIITMIALSFLVAGYGIFMMTQGWKISIF